MAEDSTIVIIESGDNTIVVKEQEVAVINVYESGGGGGSGIAVANIITKNAGATLSALKVVYSDGDNAFYASSDDVATGTQVVGVSTLSAAIGSPIPIMTFGEISDPSFNFTVGPLFLGLNGNLTQTPASTGVHLQVGIALDADTILVRIDTPIFLD